VICYWNSNIYYESSEYNCQTFVDEVLKELGIELKFGGALGVYINNLRKFGWSDMIYNMSSELQEVLNMKEKAIKFENHQELDEFVKKILKHDPKYFYSEKTKDDLMLLKSFVLYYHLMFLG
jgi:hypothetical protein